MGWARNYTYTYPDEDERRRRSRDEVSTSGTEVLQITIAYLVMTFDLLIIFGNVDALDGFDTSFLSAYFVPLLLTAAGAALTGFVAHEMAHKISAERRGFWAEFRLSVSGLIVSIVTALIGFLWAAPGATVIGGVGAEDREDWGQIALAGPLSNVVFGVVFYLVSVGLFLANSIAYFWILILALVNAWFGTFNLIPVGPLDGQKVLRWSTGVWIVAFLGSAAFTIAMVIAFYVYGDPLFI